MKARERSIVAKVARLAGGGAPRVLDLFSGAGGLMLGFHRAGCKSVGGVDSDPHASRSYAANFHSEGTGSRSEYHAKEKDITELAPKKFIRRLGHTKPMQAVDLLVGGPPCPTFTRVGRAKLREVHEHPRAFRRDPRAKLYLPYLRFAEELAPVALLMENVPDFLNWGGHNLAEEICDVLEELGYQCAYTLLNSANYGVPQMRERFYLLAIHERAGAKIQFPAPSHKVTFPRGYHGSREVALKSLRSSSLFDSPPRYVPTPAVERRALPPVTVEEAIGDLPPITGHLDGTIRRGARRFDVAVTYRDDAPVSKFALSMRKWPGFEGNGKIYDHVTRSLSERDYRLFRRMAPGDDYPRAYQLAERLFADALKEMRRSGVEVQEESEEYTRVRRNYVPPYDANKFPNKWRKMERDQPARTLMAHLGKDSYTHIHYDSEQARVLSVREAARLQSFPDGFRFSGTMNPAFRQIGNAVPPLMAFHLADELLRSLGLRVQENGHGEAAAAADEKLEARPLGSGP